MTDRSAPMLQDLNTGLFVSAAVLVGVGAAIGLAGVGLGTAAIVAAARHWYQRNELTPMQHAKRTWAQARAAGAAGAGAWKGVDKGGYTQSTAP
jgi:hypothetical protein